MKLHAGLGIAMLLAVTQPALAEDNDGGMSEITRPSRERMITDPGRAEFLSADQVAAGGSINSHLIYLNNCRPGGCVLRSGFEDSRANASSIISGARTIPALSAGFSDSVWNEIVQCVRNMYAPFDIDIVDDDPCAGSTTCGVPHWESIVAGRPQDAGMGPNTGGVSPWTNQCSSNIINNSITFTFAELYGPNVAEICWTVAQETAHSFGLDHEVLANDPMTYLGASCPGGSPTHAFQNVAAPCGECSNRACTCDGNTQNSYQKILGIFGSATPSPPVVTIIDPLVGEAVGPGFSVEVTVADANGVASVRLEVDGQSSGTVTSVPYILDAPSNLSEGVHVVKVTAVDTQGTEGSTQINVVIGEPCETPGDCSEQGENLTCVGGRCVPGSGAPGGLGTDCEEGTECSSGRCEHSSEGSYCVEICTVGSDDCPGGFQCISGGGGVCWPGEGDGGGCLSTNNDTPTLPIMLGVTLAALLVRRRRRA